MSCRPTWGLRSDWIRSSAAASTTCAAEAPVPAVASAQRRQPSPTWTASRDARMASTRARAASWARRAA
eukprot:scaffold1321_cov97-Isochrysis_galbana.AAC.3